MRSVAASVIHAVACLAEVAEVEEPAENLQTSSSILDYRREIRERVTVAVATPRKKSVNHAHEEEKTTPSDSWGFTHSSFDQKAQK